MKLIDIDALNKVLDAWFQSLCLDEFSRVKDPYNELYTLVDRLKNVPIALDTNEIIEKLEDYLFERYCIEDESEIAKIINGENYDEAD